MNSIAEAFKVPQIDRSDVTITKEHGYYDGPTCGLAEYKGLPYYFNWVDEDQDSPDTRVFALYEMTSEQVAWFAKLDDWWDLCDSIAVDWEDFCKMFYEKYPTKIWPQFAPNQMVAWFTGL